MDAPKDTPKDASIKDAPKYASKDVIRDVGC